MLALSTTLTSSNAFSTFMVLVTKPLKARSICMMIPADAPKATTRALDASRDLVNSSALTVALDKPEPKARTLSPPFPAPPKDPPIVLPSFENSLLSLAISLSAALVLRSRSTDNLSVAISLVYYYTIFRLPIN